VGGLDQDQGTIQQRFDGRRGGRRAVDHGDPARLLASVGLDADGIRASITNAMSE